MTYSFDFERYYQDPAASVYALVTAAKEKTCAVAKK
jgi:hypothetical protein